MSNQYKIYVGIGNYGTSVTCNDCLEKVIEEECKCKEKKWGFEEHGKNTWWFYKEVV